MENIRDIQAFLKGNAEKKRERVPFVASKRFKDGDGKAIPFELRLLTGEEITELQSNSTSFGGGEVSYDGQKFAYGLVASCVVFPDLNNAELQDAYGVMEPKDLLDAMLEGGEFMKLYDKCQEINGMKKDLSELIGEAKN